MKKNLKRIFLYNLSAVGAIFFFCINLSAVSSAIGYTLYYTDANKNELKKLFDDGEKFGDLEGKIKIVVTDSGIFGDKGVFEFTADINNQLNNVEGGNDTSDNYYATKELYCKDGSLSLETPADKPYEKIYYSLGLSVDNMDEVEKLSNHNLYGGITRIDKFNPIGSTDDIKIFYKGSENNWGKNFNVTLLDDDGDHGGSGGNAKDHTGCFDKLPRGKLPGGITNFWKLNQSQKDKVKDALEKNGGLAATSTPAGSGTPEAGTQCQGGGLGWLFCPFVDAMTQTVQTTGGLIDSMLNVRFLAVGKNDPQGSSQAIKTITQSILAVANILLVVAFLIIIFSQATQQGLSNYNVKRMLPRLVMAAILMNLSFYICAAAIDLSNIVGGSIMGFILGKGNTIQSALYSATGGSGGTLAALVAGSVALVALMFFLLVPVVLTILAVFAMLVGRQVILMCLVIISPLAFVAWLLPNTEKYFKKWLDLFVQLLFIYPIIMFVFAVSLFLANLVGVTGDSIIPVPGLDP